MEPNYNLLTIVGSHQDNAFESTLELGTDFKQLNKNGYLYVDWNIESVLRFVSDENYDEIQKSFEKQT